MLTASIIAVAWFALAFVSGYVIGSILRERAEEYDDAPRVELVE